MIMVFADWTVSLSFSNTLCFSRCTSHLVQVQRVPLCRGARWHLLTCTDEGVFSRRLWSFSLVCLFGLKIPSSLRWRQAPCSRAHTGGTELQTLSGWDASTPEETMSHGSATDWRVLSSYVGGGWRQNQSFKVTQINKHPKMTSFQCRK